MNDRDYGREISDFLEELELDYLEKAEDGWNTESEQAHFRQLAETLASWRE